MPNKVLLISTEFPPASKSSGVQRIFNFVRYLPTFGWQPLVLTMHPMAYGVKTSHQPFSNLPGTVVKQALAFNTAIHFAFKGRYLSWMALPDRWVSWVFFGFFSGINIVRKNKPNLIFVSYPHASALLLALLLHRVTNLPLVADFRDPMLYFNTGVHGTRETIYRWLEKKIIQRCQYAIFTTPGAIEYYAKQKFPEYPDNKWQLIENGFDENDFLQAESNLKSPAQSTQHCITLLHAGLLSPDDRDPSAFFQAVANLSPHKTIPLRIILRASSNEENYQQIINSLNLQSIIFLKPSLPYDQALTEMLSVDGLLIFQGKNCNTQVPAKLYEYFRAKKPIFALTPLKGDTARLLQKSASSYIVDLEDSDAITNHLTLFLQDLKKDAAFIAADEFIQTHTRSLRTKKLVKLLTSCLLL